MLLKKGMRGEEVKTLQMTLKLRGYDIGPYGADGVFGDSTEKAVKEFQRDHNLEADGIVGPATQAALHKDYSGNTDYGDLIKMGSSGPQVAEMQRLLINAGFSVGPAGADGIFGQGTYEAVKKFQKSRGLDVDGIIGPKTKAALRNSSSNGGAGRLLRKGDRGEDVKTLQMTLKLRGYDIGPYGADGVFGDSTERAVIAFQKDHNLEADGIVGPATQAALHKDYSGNTDYGDLIKMGASGPHVAEVQRLLIRAGYSVGPAGADGIFGQGTYNAVVKFQKDKGLSADGIVGPDTKKALGFGSSNSSNNFFGGEGVKGFLEAAKSQLGYRESGVNITKYGSWYGVQDEWCAIFVSWCANQVGILNKLVPKYAWCESGASWYKNIGRYGWRGKYTPKPGDVIFFYNSKKKAPYYHTGIVEYVENDRVHTIEGNADDAVRRRSYSLSYSDIQGYGMNGGIKHSYTQKEIGEAISKGGFAKLFGISFNKDVNEYHKNIGPMKITLKTGYAKNIGTPDGKITISKGKIGVEISNSKSGLSAEDIKRNVEKLTSKGISISKVEDCIKGTPIKFKIESKNPVKIGLEIESEILKGDITIVESLEVEINKNKFDNDIDYTDDQLGLYGLIGAIATGFPSIATQLAEFFNSLQGSGLVILGSLFELIPLILL